MIVDYGVVDGFMYDELKQENDNLRRQLAIEKERSERLHDERNCEKDENTTTKRENILLRRQLAETQEILKTVLKREALSISANAVMRDSLDKITRRVQVYPNNQGMSLIVTPDEYKQAINALSTTAGADSRYKRLQQLYDDLGKFRWQIGADSGWALAVNAVRDEIKKIIDSNQGGGGIVRDFEVLKAVKSILCPMSCNYHPIEKCAECSYCENKTMQVLIDGAAIEYIFCSRLQGVLIDKLKSVLEGRND